MSIWFLCILYQNFSTSSEILIYIGHVFTLKTMTAMAEGLYVYQHTSVARKAAKSPTPYLLSVLSAILQLQCHQGCTECLHYSFPTKAVSSRDSKSTSWPRSKISVKP